MPSITRLEVGVVQVHVARRRRSCRLCTSPPLDSSISSPRCGRHDRAVAAVHVGVRERRVGDRHLQRDRSAGRPDRPRGACCRRRSTARPVRPRCRSVAVRARARTRAPRLVLLRAPRRGRGRCRSISLGRSMPVWLADAELVGHVLDHVAVAVGELADFEEVGVRGDLQRFHQPHRAVVGVARVAELLRRDVDALARRRGPRRA